MSVDAKCRSCGAAIFWATTSNGKAMPLDSVPNDEGNVIVRNDGGTLRATVLTGDLFEDPALQDQPIYMPHFATCPNASTHRKAKP